MATPADPARYNALIAAHHYLGYTPLAGAQQRYLVQTDAGTLAALGSPPPRGSAPPATGTSAGTPPPASSDSTSSSATPAS